MTNNKIPKTLKTNVLNELTTMPNNIKLAIGKETFSREELIEHVEQEDKIGLLLAKIHDNFLKALASGEVSKFLANSNH